MANLVAPFLMFEGVAEEAMTFYVSLFPNSAVTRIEKYGPGQPGPEGSVKRANFTVNGQTFVCSDSFVKHAFTFTPSISIYVECADDAELTSAYNRLSEGGQVFMALDNYGFSTRFGWVSDRFGVSWQLNLV